jgi:predicted dehydrogenase
MYAARIGFRNGEGMKKVRQALVGAGRLGGFHAEKIARCALSELVGVYDPCRANAECIAQKHGVPVFESLGTLLPVADAVTIAAPTTEHAALGRFFLERGKHLLIEKPLTATAAEAAALKATAQSRHLVLQTGHTERFNPAWRGILPTVEAMTTPIIFDATRVSPYSFRCTDVGVVLDIMIHDLELVLSVCHSPVTSVSAVSFDEFGGHEDTCAAQIHFECGSMARFFASRTERQPKREMSIHSRGKRIFLDFSLRRAEVVSTDPKILAGDYAPEKTIRGEILPPPPEFVKEHYETEIFERNPIDPLQVEEEEFVKSILTGDTVSQDFGAEAVALAERILAACRNRDRS